MEIRQEIEKDYGEVYKLVQEAFETAEHADGNEQSYQREGTISAEE